jgi:hypothetical protein
MLSTETEELDFSILLESTVASLALKANKNAIESPMKTSVFRNQFMLQK